MAMKMWRWWSNGHCLLCFFLFSSLSSLAFLYVYLFIILPVLLLWVWKNSFSLFLFVVFFSPVQCPFPCSFSLFRSLLISCSRSFFFRQLLLCYWGPPLFFSSGSSSSPFFVAEVFLRFPLLVPLPPWVFAFLLLRYCHLMAIPHHQASGSTINATNGGMF